MENKRAFKNTYGLLWGLFLLFGISSCIDQVEAEYSYEDNVLFIDAFALTEEGASKVTISRSRWDDPNYSIDVVPNAKVQFENINTSQFVNLNMDPSGAYICPPDFAVEEGEVWKLYIELEDGRRIESKPEEVLGGIAIDEITAEYSPEIIFNTARDKFVPGHRINIDWQDPEEEGNFYLWKYRTFEPLFVCKTCNRGILRNGDCQSTNSPFGPEYYSYVCEPACWQIKFEERPIIFEDRLANGSLIRNKEIVILPFNRRPDILIEVQQLSISQSTYDYYKIINDLINASGGLNAPPSAPLLGNLFNPENTSEIILGQFTAAGFTSKSIFIDRSNIQEFPFRPDDPIILEPCASCPTTYPCMESLTRTPIEPQGWQ